MSNKRTNRIFGVVLILFGGLLLAGTMGFIPALSQAFWAVAFGIASLSFAVIYLFNGRQQPTWLIPASITGGLALVIALGLTGTNDGQWLGALFMASVSAPFWIIFLLNRKDHWWALIPGWVTAVITTIILVSEQWAGESIGALVMWSIAVPFFVVYLRNRTHWWALLPAFIMAGIGLVVLLATQNSGEMIGSIVMLVMAFPFLAVFFVNKGQWWAVIPAGIFVTLALIIPIAAAVGDKTLTGRLLAAFIFVGFAIPFAWLYWRRERYATNWAKYPVVGLLAAAIVTFVFGTVAESNWPVILIALGAWLLYENLRQPKLRS